MTYCACIDCMNELGILDQEILMWSTEQNHN